MSLRQEKGKGEVGMDRGKGGEGKNRLGELGCRGRKGLVGEREFWTRGRSRRQAKQRTSKEKEEGR